MCLGVPGKVESVWEAEGTRMAKVDFGGVRKEVCLAYVPDVGVGDYTIVHVGFALTSARRGVGAGDPRAVPQRGPARRGVQPRARLAEPA